MKILQVMYLPTRKNGLNFGSRTHLDGFPGIFQRWDTFAHFGTYLWKKTDIHENFTRDVSLDREVHIMFVKSQTPGLPDFRSALGIQTSYAFS